MRIILEIMFYTVLAAHNTTVTVCRCSRLTYEPISLFFQAPAPQARDQSRRAMSTGGATNDDVAHLLEHRPGLPWSCAPRLLACVPTRIVGVDPIASTRLCCAVVCCRRLRLPTSHTRRAEQLWPVAPQRKRRSPLDLADPRTLGSPSPGRVLPLVTEARWAEKKSAGPTNQSLSTRHTHQQEHLEKARLGLGSALQARRAPQHRSHHLPLVLLRCRDDSSWSARRPSGWLPARRKRHCRIEHGDRSVERGPSGARLQHT